MEDKEHDPSTSRNPGDVKAMSWAMKICSGLDGTDLEDLDFENEKVVKLLIEARKEIMKTSGATTP